jgi:IS5 family transposase
MGSFLMVEAERRVRESQLMRVNKLIDWDKVEKIVGKLGRSGYGPIGYSIKSMIKALVLQAWHSLSDPKLEEALKVRLDFMLFTGFEENVPDETSFCLFRNKLTKLELWEKVLNEINAQLVKKGLAVEASLGAVVDATIIMSVSRPDKEVDGIVEDRYEDGSASEVCPGGTRFSKDVDARWVKKGNKSYFGYKAFVVTDATDGFIRRVEVASANIAEVKCLSEAIGNMQPRRVYGDKGYASNANREMLKERGIRNGIMYKATRNKQLGLWQKKFNRLISKTRFIVEQAFGTLKRLFLFTRASYLGTEKVKAQTIMKAIAFNLLKASNIAQKAMT